MSSSNFTPKCVATTGDVFRQTVSVRGRQTPKSNSFRSARFSPDGTTIISHNEDQCLRSFVLPPDLLDEKDEPGALSTYSTFKAGSNIQAYTVYPGFNLQDPATALVLSSSAHVPITLRNALSFETVQGHYTFVHSKTEEHRSANSVAFTRNGSHFIAGGDNVLAIFDCHRNGEGPVSEHRLKPGKGAAQWYDSWSLNRGGIVSAIGISNEGAVAVGTHQREVGIYDHEGLGQCASSFALEGRCGSGVTDLKWSPDGTYLLVAERQSDIVQVYDIRYQHKMVSTLSGRNTKTTQKLDIDLVPTANGYEIWAGGVDGSVRMWSNPGSREGDHTPDAVVAMHGAPISSAKWHPTGVVFATCSGERLPLEGSEVRVDDEQSDDSASDSSVSSASTQTSSDVSGTSSIDPSSKREYTSGPDNTLNIWTPSNG